MRGIRLTQRRGAVVSALMASLEDEIIVVSSAGVMIRTSVRQIAAQGRDATGVRVMNLDDGQTVAAVAKVPQETEAVGRPVETADHLIAGDAGLSGWRCSWCSVTVSSGL